MIYTKLVNLVTDQQVGGPILNGCCFMPKRCSFPADLRHFASLRGGFLEVVPKLCNRHYGWITMWMLLFLIMLWKFLWLNPACCGCFFEFRKPICKDLRNMLDWCISPMCFIFHPLRTMECESITNVSISLSGYDKTTWVDLRQLHASMCCLPQILQCPAVTCPANPLQIIPNLLGTWRWHHSMPSRLNEVGAEAPKFIMKYHDNQW